MPNDDAADALTGFCKLTMTIKNRATLEVNI